MTTAVAGATVDVTLTGTNFVEGGTTIGVDGAGVAVTNINVRGSDTASATLIIDGAADVGAHVVTVATSAGVSSGTTFTVTAPPPTITTIDTTTGAPGSTVAVTIYGTNFVQGQTTVTVSGSGVTVATVTVAGVKQQRSRADRSGARPRASATSTSLTVTLTIDPSAAPGPRSITVTTPGSGSTTTTFTVSDTIIGTFTATPSAIVPGASATLAWTGVTGASSCSIDPAVGTVPCADGSVKVMPAATTTYTLTAGVAAKSATVAVSSASTGHLAVSLAGTGTGRIRSLPAGLDCGYTDTYQLLGWCDAEFPAGTAIQLLGAAGPWSSYGGWSGNPDCTDGRVTIVPGTTIACSLTVSMPRPSLIITGAVVRPGSSSQFAATSFPAGGGVQDVTGLAAWTSSNPSVATVDGSGNVTGVSIGSTDIRAAYAGATATYNIFVNVVSYLLTGIITDAADSSTLAGAAVSVADSTGIPKSGNTDPTGRYHIDYVAAGPVTVTASSPGHQTASKTAAFVQGTEINIALPRTSGSYVIAFTGLPTGALTAYAEDAFTVTPTLQTWLGPGRAGFIGPAGQSVDGELQITSVNTFSFQALDLLGDLASVPYVITGKRNNVTQFVQTGTAPFESGRFVGVSSTSAALIDTLIIRLTSTAPACCSNLVAIDNVTVGR